MCEIVTCISLGNNGDVVEFSDEPQDNGPASPAMTKLTLALESKQMVEDYRARDE